MKSIIFHYPLQLSNQPESGSQVRPSRMIKAFRQLGYRVETVVGSAEERRRSMELIREMMKAGHRFDFAYAESSTMPTLLTEPHHMPTYPLLDFRFFKYLKKQSIPVGLFYRDAYWRFSVYARRVSFPKRHVARAFYWYDWIRYRELLNHLFLPTTKMLEVLPSWTGGTVSALPPGCEEYDPSIPDASSTDISMADRSLRLFYVGGIQPPLYNMRPMLEVVNELEGVSLTICCRESEWQECELFYERVFDAQKMHIVHAHGFELADYYRSADMFIDLRKEHAYWRYTLPLKVFEPIGFGLPSIIGYCSEAARFVERNETGWVVRSVEEAATLLHRLRHDRQVIQQKREHLKEIRTRHTWECRAREVEKQLAPRTDSGE